MAQGQIKLVIKDELKRLERDLGKIGPDVVRKAAPAAINRTGVKVKSVAVKEISAITGTIQKRIRREIKHKLAGRDGLESYVDATEARARNLASFVTPARKRFGAPGEPQFFRRMKGRQGARVYKHPGVMANAWRTKRYYRGTWLAKGKSGNAIIMARKGPGRRAETKVLPGPSTRREFVRPAMTRLLTETANKRFPVEMNRSVERVLRRYRK